MPFKDFKFWLQYLPSNLEDIFGDCCLNLFPKFIELTAHNSPLLSLLASSGTK